MSLTVHVRCAWGLARCRTTLRCEYLCDPLGIDATQPRLSWQLHSKAPGGTRAIADVPTRSYRCHRLRRGIGMPIGATCGTPGKVDSEQSQYVTYQGRLLQSEQSCWWKVRVWDQDSKASDWSKPARWSMGLLKLPRTGRVSGSDFDEPLKPATSQTHSSRRSHNGYGLLERKGPRAAPVDHTLFSTCASTCRPIGKSFVGSLSWLR